MAADYNTTMFIEENDRIPYNIETARKGTKTYNTAELLIYFYNRFQEILNTNGRVTIEDLEQIYNEQPYYVENSYYIQHSLFDRSHYQYYYISSKPFNQRGDTNVRIELTCPLCGDKYTPQIYDLSTIPRCYCQYMDKVIPERIERLKQTDELYLKYHENPIGNTTYIIDDISYTYYSAKLHYTYILKCTKCGIIKEVVHRTFNQHYNNHTEHGLFSRDANIMLQ